ncbi:MAG: YfhO family protein [Magnetococcales bacterium]|nr:YfhO family protein [Magnetococcales bacterium]
MGDHADSFFSNYAATAAQGLSAHLWSPLQLSGTDYASSYIHNIDQYLFFVMPAWLVNGLFHFIQLFLSGYFTYRLLVDDFSVKRFSALLGGIICTLVNDPPYPQLGLALELFPWMAWTAIRLTNWPKRTFAVLTGFVCGVVYALNAPFFISITTAPLLGVFFWVHPQRWNRSFIQVAMGMLAGMVLPEIPHLLSELLNAPLSHRANSADMSGEIRFDPDMFLYVFPKMVIPWLLSILGIMLADANWKRTRIGTYLVISILTFSGLYLFPMLLVIVTHLTTAKPWILFKFGWWRWVFYTFFFAAITSALAIHHLAERWESCKGQSLPRLAGRVALAILVVLLTYLLARKTRNEISAIVFEENHFAAYYKHPQLLAWAKDVPVAIKKRYRAVMVSDGASNLHTAILGSYGFETADGYMNVYPKRYHDFWSLILDPAMHDSRYSEFIRDYFLKWGHRAYLYTPANMRQNAPSRKPTFRDNLAESSLPLNVGSLYDMNLLSLANVRYIVSRQPLDDFRLHPVPTQAHFPRLTNPAQTWCDPAITTDTLFTALYRLFACLGQQSYPGPLPVHIYENSQVLPRAFLTERTQILPTKEDVMAAMGKAGIEQLRSTAYMTAADAGTYTPPSGIQSRLEGVVDSVSIQATGPDHYAFVTESTGDAMLVVTNSYSSYWQATIDNQPAHLFPVDLAFQGVPLPPGRHEVRLTYLPPYAVWRLFRFIL